MTGDPDADEHTDKEGSDDELDSHNNNMSTRQDDSDSDLTSQEETSSDCGTTSSLPPQRDCTANLVTSLAPTASRPSERPIPAL